LKSTRRRVGNRTQEVEVSKHKTDVLASLYYCDHSGSCILDRLITEAGLVKLLNTAILKG